ncbi:hypothetical protein, partial [Serratia marcescens]|uniref:hypothetical protein n=1 Tax=Serratia marcescens TaxID=615 RepID=UPI0027E3B7DC
AEFTIGEGELMAHDVPLGCAPDEYDDLISGTCSHLPYICDPLNRKCQQAADTPLSMFTVLQPSRKMPAHMKRQLSLCY